MEEYFEEECETCFGLRSECKGEHDECETCFAPKTECPAERVRFADGTRPYYVVVYEATREYGGPEEGGWWYDAGTAIKTVICRTEDEACLLREQLEKEYPRTGRRSSVLGGDDYEVRVECEPKQCYPDARPHYE